MNSMDNQTDAFTVLKLAEASLRANELAEMLESSSQAFTLLYVDKRLNIFNNSFALMLGYSWDELKNLDWGCLTPEEWRKIEQEKLEELHRTGLPVRYEKEYIRKDGIRFPVELYWNLHHDAQGQVDYRYAFITDITERKLAQELRDHIERVIQHDLRAPASSAVQLARLLRDETSVTKEQRLHLLDRLEQAGENMLGTLNSSLDIFKLETGQYQLNPESVNCLDLLRSLIATLLKKVQFASIHLDVLVSGKPPKPVTHCFCLGNSHLLHTALHNLLINALEAAMPSGVVAVELSSSERDCKIRITNNGVVPVEIRDKFFDRYVTSGKFAGTGIGTYSARMMVKAMGGDISMSTSDVDNDTTVTVRMPC